MTYTIKTEYLGDVFQLIREGLLVCTFDTNNADPSTYEYFYNIGFEWVFDVS